MSDANDPAMKAIEALAEVQWPHTIKLRHPFEFAGKQIASLVFQRGKMKTLKGVKLDGVPPTDQLLLIASRMCGEPVAALEELDAEDCGEVLQLALTFFAKCLGVGSTP